MRRAESGLSSGEYADRGENKLARVNIVGRISDFWRIFQNIVGLSHFRRFWLIQGPLWREVPLFDVVELWK